MPLTLSNCLRELKLQGIDLDPEDFCDAVWLTARGFSDGEARLLQSAPQPIEAPSQPFPKRPSPSPNPDRFEQPEASPPVHALGDSGGRQMRGTPISLPTAPAMIRGVEFDRSMRPLRQRRQLTSTMELDEESTVAAIAETGIWQLVMRPARGRWLNITLVVEQSPTMRLWQETAIEFRELLWRACSPRSLRTFHLVWSPKRLLLQTVGGRSVHKHAPCHGSGNQLIMVLSDAMSFGWLSADIPELLAHWATFRSTTLVQMLPQSMWKRSALRQATLGTANQPRASAASRASADLWPPVIIASLDPDYLRRYSRMLTGAGAGGVATYRGSRAQFQVVTGSSVQERAPFNAQALSGDEVDKIFQRFERFSSPEARKLARHLASAPLVLPIMRLVQRVLVPDAAPAHLAEIFLSGILYRRDTVAASAVPTNQVEYEFLPGVREHLRDSGGLDFYFETIGLLSRYFEQRLGKGNAFTALLENPTAAKDWSIADSGPQSQLLTRAASIVVEQTRVVSQGVAKHGDVVTTDDAELAGARPQYQSPIRSKRSSDTGKTATQSGPWRTIRVYISSTLRDMHAERDYLVKVVFPALREKLEQQRVHLVDIDLRWGITREQAENDQALELCLQEIDECRPFFIGILGERYGWVPTRYPADAVKKFSWLGQHTGKSVTELEFLHGALLDSKMRGRAFFFFRDPMAVRHVPEAVRRDVYVETDTESIRKLDDLKQQIRISGYPVMENYPARWDANAYDEPSKSHGRLVGLKAFGERVSDQLWQAIQEELQLPDQPPAVTAADSLAEEQDYHERFMEFQLRVYVGREQINNELLAFADGNDLIPCLVTGPSGSGKSAALARFVHDYQHQQPQTLVIPHFIGASPRSTNLRDMLRRFCLVLKARFGFAEDVPEEAAKLSVTFREFVSKVPADTRVLLAIDALNQLDESDRAQDLYWLPTDFPPQVKVIVSCISEAGVPASAGPPSAQPVLEEFYHRKHYPLELTALSDAEQRLVIRQVLSQSAKTLDEDQMRLLLSNPATINPLFLRVALEELRGFATYEPLNERIAAFPREGDTVTALFTQVIEQRAEEFNPKLVEAALTLLASARRGLSERELTDLVDPGDPEGNVAALVRSFRTYLRWRNDRLDFAHREFRAAVDQLFLATETQRREAHEKLAKYFSSQDGREGAEPRPPDVPQNETTPRSASQINPRLFLSYSRGDDGEFVQRLYDDLTARGFDVWFDRVNMPSRGRSFQQESRDAIQAQDRLILVIGPQAVTSEYVRQDWQFAYFEAEKCVTPILRQGDYSIIPDELKLLHCEDFRDEAGYSVHLKNLIRQLNEPVPRLGKLIGVPELPPDYRAQPDRFLNLLNSLLADVQKSNVTTSPSAPVGIHGMGGIGKSVLAAALARNLQVRQTYPDGIIWISLGPAPNLLESMRCVHRDLGGDGIFVDEHAGKTKLRELLIHQAVLLVIDDVWRRSDVDAFDVLGPRSKLLLTTRDAGLVAALSSTAYQVQLPSGEEALALLASAAQTSIDSLPPEAIEVVAKCGRLPLALKLSGGMVRAGTSWADTLAALREHDLVFLSNEHADEGQHRNIWRAMEVSIRALPEDQQQRFAELAVFPEDARIPESTVLMLWAQTAGLSERHARQTLVQLKERSLIQFDQREAGDGRIQRLISLHDLLHDFAIKLAGDLHSHHQQLLEAYSRICGNGWMSGPDDGYLFQHLAHHLRSAGRIEELRQSPDLREFLILHGSTTMRGHEQGVRCVAFSPDGRHVLSGADDKTLRLWDAYSAQELAVLRGHESSVTSVVFSPDGQRILSGSRDGTARLWDALSGQEVAVLRGHEGRLHSVAYSPDARRVASGSSDRTVRLWDAESGEQLAILRGHERSVESVAFSPEGLRILSGSEDKTLRMWDAQSGQPLAVLRGHSDSVTSVAFSPNGNQVLSGSRDGTLHLWDARSGQEVSVHRGHDGGVQSVAFAPDGCFFASVTAHGIIRIGDISFEAAKVTSVRPEGFATSVGFSPDGWRLVVGSKDGTVKTYPLDALR